MSFFDKLFGLDRTTKPMEDAELLTTAYSNAEEAALEALLDSAEIPYQKRDRGAGGALKIVVGYSMFGTDFYVRKETLDDAKALLTALSDGDCEDVGEAGDETDKSEDGELEELEELEALEEDEEDKNAEEGGESENA